MRSKSSFLMASLLAAFCANADTIVSCPPQSPNCSSPMLLGVPGSNDLVAVVLPGPGIGSGTYDFDLSKVVWREYSSTASDDLIAVCETNNVEFAKCISTPKWRALERRSFLPPPGPPDTVPVITPQSTVPSTSYCTDVQESEVRYSTDLLPELRRIVTWYCAVPRFIQANCRINYPLRSGPRLNVHSGMTAEEKKQLEKDTAQFDLNAEEHAACLAVHKKYGPKLTVATSGTAKNRTIYLATSTHERGADSKKTVPINSPCFVGDRLVTVTSGVEAATSYFLVLVDDVLVTDTYDESLLSKILNAKILGYAECKVTGPVSK